MTETSDAARWRIPPHTTPELDDGTADSTDGGPGDRAATEAASAALRERLADLQARLWAEGARALLLILQAPDAGGKDGTIRSVFGGVNPQGVQVTSFKAPTDEELAHDFLWRVHRHAPRAGDIAVFNRSHYEDVLVPRVHELVPEAVWRARYGHIVAFEQLLAESGTEIVKIHLHVSKEEQRERLQKRIDNPRKHWKFHPGDLEARRRFDDYMAAYRDAIERTTVEAAPWYVVPADHKWFRDWVVLTILVETLERMDPRFPPPEFDVEGVVVE